MNQEVKKEGSEDPIVMTIKNEKGEEKTWKQSECNEAQLFLIADLQPIAERMKQLENEWNHLEKNKQYRIKEFQDIDAKKEKETK